MRSIEKSLEYRAALRRFLVGWLRPGLLDEEKFRRELNETLQAHWTGNPINVHELIFESWDEEQKGSSKDGKKNHIVYIDHEFGVDWIYDGKLDKKSSECVSKAESVGAQRCRHLPKEQVLELKRLVGQAIVNGINGNAQEACQLAESAALFLRDRTVERSREWTLASANIFLILAIMLFFYLYRIGTSEDSTFSGILIACSGGLLGAFISVIMRAGKGDWNAASGLQIHIIEVFTKLFVGAAFGLVTFTLSMSVHSPPSIRLLTPDNYSLFVLGFASGFFENLIPKMITKYSDIIKEP